jgi:peptide chain release factor 1
MISKTQLYRKAGDIASHYGRLQERCMDPEVTTNPTLYMELAKEMKLYEPVVQTYKELQQLNEELAGAESLLKEPDQDPDMLELAVQEKEELSSTISKLEKQMEIQLLPKDPLDEKNIIVELRAGAGGDEAGLFVSDLFRMYTKYAEKMAWKHEVISSNETGIGGFKELTFTITGDRVYSRMKFESGVHRVQRVPATESSGRIHTSTITVAVLPEVEEVDFEINASEVRVDTYCASGPGGQSVNTTYSAVRLTHTPTGTIVTCQDEKSQIKNKEKAFKVLRARLAEIERRKQQEQYAKERSQQVGTGDRAEKIRTYNFPQGRISDHRIGLTVHNLGEVLEGNLTNIIESLIAEEQKKKLESLGEDN